LSDYAAALGTPATTMGKIVIRASKADATSLVCRHCARSAGGKTGRRPCQEDVPHRRPE
jgi:hypothetical protein